MPGTEALNIAGSVTVGVSPAVQREAPPSRLVHSLRAMRGNVSREVFKFAHQYGRLASALVRPALWLVTFAVGMQNLFGVAPIEPYSTYIPYQEYMVPG